MFSPVSFSPFQLRINQASSDFSHVSYLPRGHANCNGKPRKSFGAGEDTWELIQLGQKPHEKLLMGSPSACASPAPCQCCLRAPACVRNGDLSAPNQIRQHDRLFYVISCH